MALQVFIALPPQHCDAGQEEYRAHRQQNGTSGDERLVAVVVQNVVKQVRHLLRGVDGAEDGRVACYPVTDLHGEAAVQSGEQRQCAGDSARQTVFRVVGKLR